MATQHTVGRGKPSLQVKHKKDEQDVEPFATKYSCATHQVTYYVPVNRKAGCPVCELDGEVAFLRDLAKKYENEITMLRAANQRMDVEVNVSAAMVNAMETLDEADRMWLKEQLYQYKLDKSVVLKVTHGAPQGRSRRRDMKTPNGFIAMRRKGDPEGHVCSSIGGLALARYYEEASTTYGAQTAMDLMIKALWKFLPGARP